MVIEESIYINACAERLFDIYKDVTRWNLWDPDTKESFLEGPFTVGATGRLIPTKGYGVPMKLTALAPNRSFTVESSIPLFQMKFEHELIPQGSGTYAVHRVTFSGPLNFILGKIVAKRVREGLPKTMQSLKTYAETMGPRTGQLHRSSKSQPAGLASL